VLVTGFDIIYFWVARMLMMGLHFMGTEPFADVVIHGLVRDVEGRKMSKSGGNALDPLELVARYGADSVRLTLVQSAAPGHDIPLNEEWIDASRRFGNKVWNAVRFAVEHGGVTEVPENGGYPEDPGPEDAWVLWRLNDVGAVYDAMLDEYRFSDAIGLLYNFAWAEVFDWYLEMAKSNLRDEQRSQATTQTLGVVLRDLLKYFHPVIPFVTEELWSELGDGSMLATSTWPAPPSVARPAGIDELQSIVAAVRRFRSEHQLGPRRPLSLLVDDPDGVAGEWWRRQLAALARVDAAYQGAPAELAGHTRMTAGNLQAFVPLGGVIDVAAERPRLEKAITELERLEARSRGKLESPSFREKAPADVVAKEESKLAEFDAKLERLRTQLAELG